MSDPLINFEDMDWERPAPGVRQKVHTVGDRRMRLVEFSEVFVEHDWCTRGHIGYVLEGNMSVDFDGRIIDFKAGDGIDIPEGAENRHKAKIARGGIVLLLLFEEV
jgi:quercetin dioxygenase-like cupin family protein